MAKKILKIIGVAVIVVAVLAISLCMSNQHENTTTDDVKYFGTVQVISKEDVVNSYNHKIANQYLGFDVNTKCMYYVYVNADSISSTPYMIQTENDTTKQAIYGIDYK